MRHYYAANFNYLYNWFCFLSGMGGGGLLKIVSWFFYLLFGTFWLALVRLRNERKMKLEKACIVSWLFKEKKDIYILRENIYTGPFWSLTCFAMVLIE